MEFQRVKRSTNLDFMRASRADQMLNDATINVQQHIRYILLTWSGWDTVTVYSGWSGAEAPA